MLDFESVEKEFQIFSQFNPSNSEMVNIFSDYLLASGKSREAFVLTKDAFDKNRNSNFVRVQLALACYYDGQLDKASENIETALYLFPDDEFSLTNFIRLMVYMEKFEKAIEIFEKGMADKQPPDLIPYYLGHLGIAYFKTGNKSRSTEFLNELLKRSRQSPVGSPSFFAAALYSAMGENDKSLQMLGKAITDHEVEVYWLKVEPLFRPLHGDPRFENLLMKIGFK